MSLENIPGLDKVLKLGQDKLDDLTAREARLEEELASAKAEIFLLRRLMNAAWHLEDSAAAERADRDRVREAMRQGPNGKAWRPEQLAGLVVCPDDREALRLLMDRMVRDGELVLSSFRSYRLPPEETGARTKTPAVRP